MAYLVDLGCFGTALVRLLGGEVAFKVLDGFGGVLRDMAIYVITYIITHLASQTYVWHGCKWNFAGPQIYLQPAKIKSQYFGVSLKFLVCN